MKTCLRIIRWLAVAALLNFAASFTTVFAQGTAFSYQGKLNVGGTPANGGFDLTFALFGSSNGVHQAGSTLTNLNTGVTNGLFAVTLDFGPGIFTGTNLWLQISARTNGGGAFTTLAPLQPILPAPYAIMAESASNLLGTLPAAQLSGTLPSGVLAGYSGTVALTNGGNSFNGSFSGLFGGNGSGLTNVPGSVTWQDVTGTSAQAQPNTGYLADNAAQVTLTLPTAPNPGDIVRVSGVGAGGWAIAQNAGQAIRAAQFGGATITNRNPLTNWSQTGAPGGNYWAIASSADGTNLAAVSDGGGIINSTNSGVTWTQTGAPTAAWYSIASSADGTKLAAVVFNGGIYTSTNSGGTWTNTSAATALWYSIASSADGTNLAAVVSGGGIYASTNSGATWTQTSAPSAIWGSIASSADGTDLAAVVSGGGIYTSTNSGGAWTNTSAPSANWQSIASSADGTDLAAAVYGGGIYTSANSGTIWTQTSAPGTNWFCAASSADGTHLAAVVYGGGIYLSANSGVTWTQTSAPSENWHSIASSADGTALAAAIGLDGAIWRNAQATVLTTTTPGATGYLAGGQNSAIELQYIGNGQFLPLSHEGTISAH